MDMCQLGVDDGAAIEVRPTETDAKAVRLPQDDDEGRNGWMSCGSRR